MKLVYSWWPGGAVTPASERWRKRLQAGSEPAGAAERGAGADPAAADGMPISGGTLAGSQR